jgi:hypothetical protein
MAGVAVLAWTAAAAAGPAHAAKITLGSSLKAPARVSETQQFETLFWNTRIGGHGVAVPADGQVVLIRVKGTATPNPDPTAPAPFTMVHFQTIAPVGHGKSQIRLTSAAFQMPVGGDPNTISRFKPENLCAKRGDHVAFNEAGGAEATFYPFGVPFRVFASVKSSQIARFSKPGGTTNGEVIAPKAKKHEELLMQVVYATGRDASIPCGGKAR